jgi:GNAT superfamily N-acetyltransferase
MKTMSSTFNIRTATKAEFAIAADWARQEGWNPGLDDIEAFFAADPDGFLMGFEGETPVASISVVKYNNAYGFLGFYIVPPAHRGKGYGMAIWNAGMAYLAGCAIGLDGVQDLQDDYRKSGFVWAGRTIRYQGRAAEGVEIADNLKAVPLRARDFAAVSAFDNICFGTDRSAFLKGWISAPPSQSRLSFVVKSKSAVTGFATIRKCHNGYKIGPLFALSTPVALALFNACCGCIEPSSAIIIDVPEENTEAMKLAISADLQPVFETARMYRGPNPDLPISNIFGLTTFELG